ncbi:outer membrane lipoprotein chaperone LolA [Ramlibacter sp.]|uniref:outer membrane lipoprotein chaperone LolA n=1 Tax=Ramlibacter sp. TaxID=1917967 RepID=UPI003D133539
MKKAFASFVLAGVAALSSAAHAGALESLENFVKTAKSGRAEFTQVVTSPAKDGQVRTRNSTGTFEFSRPNRFRFTYAKPFQQTIVADGKTLWLHDVDLNQVSQRSQEKVLASTPAALIAASSDLSAMRRDFDLQALPDANGMQWVQATPKQKEGQVHSVKIGFRGNDLAALDMMDGFGQRSVLTFTKMELNTSLPATAFVFTPPSGADLVKN